MKVPQFILTAVLTGILMLHAWELNQLVKQGQDLAAIKAIMSGGKEIATR